MEQVLSVRCACGFEARGDADEVVAVMRRHGREVHNMDATAEQILALAEPDGPGARP